jgi:hypothetical protein
MNLGPPIRAENKCADREPPIACRAGARLLPLQRSKSRSKNAQTGSSHAQLDDARTVDLCFVLASVLRTATDTYSAICIGRTVERPCLYDAA